MAKKKTTSLGSKLLYFINSIFATALLLSYFLPYISPKTISLIGVFSLLVPFLIIINLLFFIYWVIKLKKHLILSGVTLLTGLVFISPFYIISNKKIIQNKDVKVMSYNVRMMNFYKWIDKKNIDKKIVDFIHEKKPDILAIQEYYKLKKQKLNYKYQYFVSNSKNRNIGMAIFSNYKIVKKGSLNFKQSSNNAIFADVVIKKDTIRVYNVHLQSLKINPKKENFGQESSEKLLKRLDKGFKKQVTQVQKILQHEQKFKGKTIICGDFNNTAYSWAYKQLSFNKNDAFLEAGRGFGKSFNYIFPMRIDFILTDKYIETNYFQTFKKKYSDHFPIMARVNLDN